MTVLEQSVIKIFDIMTEEKVIIKTTEETKDIPDNFIRTRIQAKSIK